MASGEYQGPRPGETTMPQPKMPVLEPVPSELSKFNPKSATAKVCLVRYVNKVSTRQKLAKRVLVIFMNRVLLCRENGSVSRAVHASDIESLGYFQAGTSMRFMASFRDTSEISLVWEPMNHPCHPPSENVWKVCGVLNDIRGRFRTTLLPLVKYPTMDALRNAGNHNKSAYKTPKKKLESGKLHEVRSDPPPVPPEPVFKKPAHVAGDPPFQLTLTRASSSSSFGIDMKGLVIKGGVPKSPAEAAGIEKYRGLSLIEVSGRPVAFTRDVMEIVGESKQVEATVGLRDRLIITRSLEEPLGIDFTSTASSGIQLSGVERHSPAARAGGLGFVKTYITHVDGKEVANETHLVKECEGKERLVLMMSELPSAQRAADKKNNPSVKTNDVAAAKQSENQQETTEKLEKNEILVRVDRENAAVPLGIDLKYLKIMNVSAAAPIVREEGLDPQQLVGKTIVAVDSAKVATYADVVNMMKDKKKFVLKLRNEESEPEVPPPPPSLPPTVTASAPPQPIPAVNPDRIEEPPPHQASQPKLPPPTPNDRDTLYVTKTAGEELGIHLEHFKVAGFDAGGAADRAGVGEYLNRKITHIGDHPVYTVREYMELTRIGGEICVRFEEEPQPSTLPPPQSSVAKTSNANRQRDSIPPPPPSVPPSTIDEGYVVEEVSAVPEKQLETTSDEEAPVEVYNSGTGGAYGTIMHAVAQLVDRQTRTEELLCTLLGSLRETQQNQKLIQRPPYVAVGGPPMDPTPVFEGEYEVASPEPQIPQHELVTGQASVISSGRRRVLPTSAYRYQQNQPSPSLASSSSPTKFRRSPRQAVIGSNTTPSYKRVEIDLTQGKVVLT